MSALLADSGNYSLVVTSNGCNSIKTNLNVIVKACQVTNFSIPAGFSPNGDGINDLFIISGIINYPSLSMSVYNRWGNLVFDASPYQNNWNGRSNSSVAISGEVLPIGTYFYIIDLGDGSPVRKGTIYLNK
jgi:gliding motility-associated-like protein